MIQSIFTRPLFINPQAYLVIPELMLINKSIPYDFSSDRYVFQVITSGKIECKLIPAQDTYILHLDLYTKDGNVVLGEFYLSDTELDISSISFVQSNGMVTIQFEGLSNYLQLNIGQLNIDKLQ